MVQFFKSSPDPRDAATGALAQALGQGIGHGVTSHYANKALQEVLNDESLKNAPISAKMGKLHSALYKFGDVGKELLQNTLQIEQQAENEKAQQRQFKEQEVLGKLLAGEKLTAQEAKNISPQNLIKLAEIQNKDNKPLGGLAGTPLSPEESQTIAQVLKNSQNLDADDLQLAFEEAGVIPGRYKGYVETRRRADETKAKNSVEDKKLDRKEAITFHKESEEYQKDIQKEAKNAKAVLSAVQQAKTAIESGKVKPLSLANIFKGLGTVGNKISEALINDQQAALQSAIPEFLHGRKELFGVRLSDADLALIQDKLPSIGKNKEANAEILKVLEKYANKALLKEQAAKNALEIYGAPSSGGKLRPLNYTSRVEEEYDRLVENEGKFDSLPPATKYKGKKIKDSKTGQILQSNGETWAPI